MVFAEHGEEVAGVSGGAVGGWEESTALEILKPHIFFDDQMSHLEGTRSLVPSVHVPFGVKNL